MKEGGCGETILCSWGSEVKFDCRHERNAGVKNDLGRGNCKCRGPSSIEHKDQHGSSLQVSEMLRKMKLARQVERDM